MRTALSLILILAMASPAWAWPARVVAVTDGDTITVEPIDGGRRVKIRLWGIDAPERRQPFGEASGGLVNDLVLFRVVDVLERGNDRYRRTLAVIFLPDGTCLQEILLSSGMAWVYEGYCRNCQSWYALQGKARLVEKGLWVDPDAIPPWVWRKQHRP